MKAPTTPSRDRWRAAARQQALSRLAQRHLAEFDALYAETKRELAAEYGVTDP